MRRRLAMVCRPGVRMAAATRVWTRQNVGAVKAIAKWARTGRMSVSTIAAGHPGCV